MFLLGASGLYALYRGRAGTRAAAVLISTTVWTIVLYFTVHSLHADVHPDYLSMTYPAFAVAGAVAAHLVIWGHRWQRVVEFSRRWAVPGSLALFLLIILQINVGFVTGYRADPLAKITAVGLRNVADEIARIRDRVGASCLPAGGGFRNDRLVDVLSPEGQLHRAAWRAHPLGEYA